MRLQKKVLEWQCPGVRNSLIQRKGLRYTNFTIKFITKILTLQYLCYYNKEVAGNILTQQW